MKKIRRICAIGIAMAVAAISMSGCITEPYRESGRGKDETRSSPAPTRYYPDERRYEVERPVRSNIPNEAERDSRLPRFPPFRASPLPDEASGRDSYRENRGRDEGR